MQTQLWSLVTILAICSRLATDTFAAPPRVTNDRYKLELVEA